jgi:16S rRNA G966 N2-methylase RsmD
MKNFWDFKAKKYPRPFDEGVICKTKEILKKIELCGVSFEGKDLIDIGSGTGIYGLVISQKAGRVLCFDVSDGMINILKEEAEKLNIKNVETITGNFKEYNFENYKKAFDISFASMTPAVKEMEDVLKMEYLSKDFCVYIGWAGKRENKVYDEVFDYFKVKPHIPSGYFDVRKVLDERNIRYETFIFKDEWEWKGSVDEAVDEFYNRIKLDNIEIKKNEIKNFLLKKYGEKIVMKTIASEGVIIWKAIDRGHRRNRSYRGIERYRGYRRGGRV